MPRSRKARSSVKNSEKKATVDRRVQTSSRVVKTNQPIRYKPNELRNGAGLSASSVSTMLKPPGVRMIAKEIQKPPYDERAVAPKVLPTANSLVQY